MTKKELITALAEANNISKKSAEMLLASFKSIASTALTSGYNVELGSDFGSFKPVIRQGKAPGTGKPYKSTLVKFSVSAPFKRSLNK